MTGAQLVSQHVMTEIKLLLHNTLSECLIDNLTSSFHILTQRFDLFHDIPCVPFLEENLSKEWLEHNGDKTLPSPKE
jgi:hypothetical protein